MQLRLKLLILFIASITLQATGIIAAQPTGDTLPTVKKHVEDDKALLVDVREKSEWDSGHVSGAVFLPLSQLRNGITAETLAKRIPKQHIVYTYCAVGVRSCSAADILLKHGYDVRPLKPGYKDLVAAGFEKTAK